MNDAESKIITVLAGRLPEAVKRLQKLVNKAQRYGCPDITFSVGEPYIKQSHVTDWDGASRVININVVDIIVLGEAPKIGNHEFLARVEIGADGNLVDTRPGVDDLHTKFRNTDGYCDHCKTRRRRSEVFIVRNIDTGEQLQIGKSCLRDYLGMDNPAAIAHRFAFFREVASFEDSDCGPVHGFSGWGQSLTGILTLSAVCVRLFGWCSRGQAQYDESLVPTVNYVLLCLSRPSQIKQAEDRALVRRILNERTDSDYRIAQETIEWVRNEMDSSSDYAHNLKVLFSKDYVDDERRAGIVVSAVASYLKAVERKLRLTKDREAAKKSEYVGAVGDRLRGIIAQVLFQRVVGSTDWGETVLIKFIDENSNIFTWFTSSGIDFTVGEQLVLDGTVKNHNEYNGALETQLTRCRVSEIQQVEG